MSLIPSESLHFPDSFRAKVGWRLTDEDEQELAGLSAEQGAIHNPFPETVGTPKAVVDPSALAPPVFPEPVPPPASKAASPASPAEPVKTNEQQLELMPETDSQKNPAHDAGGPAGMSELLKYFLAAGATPTIATGQPNGQDVVGSENSTAATAIPSSSAAAEVFQVAAEPNEPPVTAEVKVEPVAAPLPAELKKEPEITANLSSPQQSIIAALESLAHTDVEPPIGSVEVQTPAQANHILELIAAAVQRGALVGETVAEPSAPEPALPEPAPPPPPPPPTATPIAPPAYIPASGFSINREPVGESSETMSARAPAPIFSIPVPPVPEPPPAVLEPPAAAVELPALAVEPPAAVVEMPAAVVEPPTAIVEPSAATVEPSPAVVEPSPAVVEPSAAVVEPPPSTSPIVPGATTDVPQTHIAPVPPSPAVSVQPSSTPDAPKVPARIRITPRKIKPRPQVQPVSEEPVTSPRPGPEFSTEVSSQVKVSPGLERLPPRPVEPESKPLPKSLESPEPLMPRPELSARKIAAARLELTQSDLFLFNARERRNRWIGFGLSELAVVTALILLGRFGFTHHFPDPTLKMLVFILIFAAAAVAVALPIAFFRNDPQRWGAGR